MQPSNSTVGSKRPRGAPSSLTPEQLVAVTLRAIVRPPPPVVASEQCPETDAHRIRQRQDQVDLGTNSITYDRYRLRVPRERRNRNEPTTPDATRQIAKKRWDARVKQWKRDLQAYDVAIDFDTRAGAGGGPARNSVAAPPADPDASGQSAHGQMCPPHALDLIGWCYRDALLSRDADEPSAHAVRHSGRPESSLRSGGRDESDEESLSAAEQRRMLALAAGDTKAIEAALPDPWAAAMARLGHSSSAGLQQVAEVRSRLRAGMQAVVDQQAAQNAARHARWAAFLGEQATPQGQLAPVDRTQSDIG